MLVTHENHASYMLIRAFFKDFKVKACDLTQDTFLISDLLTINVSIVKTVKTQNHIACKTQTHTNPNNIIGLLVNQC